MDSLDKALRTLEQRHDIDLVIITVSFDESRMFDLLRLCIAKYPEIPVVCCKAFDHARLHSWISRDWRIR